MCKLWVSHMWLQKICLSFLVQPQEKKITFRQNITCADQNVIYCIQCTKCNMKYVGKTTSKFKDRAKAHRFSVDNRKSCLVSLVTTWTTCFFFAFEKIIKDDPFIVGARDRLNIDKMEVIQHGINKNRTIKLFPSCSNFLFNNS